MEADRASFVGAREITANHRPRDKRILIAFDLI